MHMDMYVYFYEWRSNRVLCMYVLCMYYVNMMLEQQMDTL